jgi:hypothetical protein
MKVSPPLVTRKEVVMKMSDSLEPIVCKEEAHLLEGREQPIEKEQPIVGEEEADAMEMSVSLVDGEECTVAVEEAGPMVGIQLNDMSLYSSSYVDVAT